MRWHFYLWNDGRYFPALVGLMTNNIFHPVPCVMTNKILYFLPLLVL